MELQTEQFRSSLAGSLPNAMQNSTAPIAIPQAEHRPANATSSSSPSSEEDNEQNSHQALIAQKPIPVELWFQKYDEANLPTAALINKKNHQLYIPEKNRITIYMPICFENFAYDPPNFERLLKGIVKQFPSKEVHFVLLITDELNRHNWAKKASKTNSPKRNSNDDVTNCSPRKPKCLGRNLSFIVDASQQCQEWLKQVKMDNLSLADTINRIGCFNITLFTWKDFKEKANLRDFFCEKMNISAGTNNMKIDASLLDTQELAKFVEEEYNNPQHSIGNISYADVIGNLLRERCKKDWKEEECRGRDDKINNKCNEAYLLEETVVQMRIIGAIGDLIDYYIHPELQKDSPKRLQRTRINFSIEWHDWWSRELLKIRTGVELLNRADLYHFMSAAYPQNNLIKHKYPAIKSDQTPKEAQDNVSDQPKRHRSPGSTPPGSLKKSPRSSIEGNDRQHNSTERDPMQQSVETRTSVPVKIDSTSTTQPQLNEQTFSNKESVAALKARQMAVIQSSASLIAQSRKYGQGREEHQHALLATVRAICQVVVELDETTLAAAEDVIDAATKINFE